MSGVCQVQECVRPIFSRVWCQKHYTRFLRHGDPMGGNIGRDLSPIDRLMRRVTKSESGCWLVKTSHSEGYGTICIDGAHVYCHRLAYTTLVGPIPDGLDIDHLCRVRNCCNPEHLEPVTRQVNAIRGVRWSGTHCMRGHEFTPENTYLRAGNRICRECRLTYQRNWHAKRRLAESEAA